MSRHILDIVIDDQQRAMDYYQHRMDQADWLDEAECWERRYGQACNLQALYFAQREGN